MKVFGWILIVFGVLAFFVNIGGNAAAGGGMLLILFGGIGGFLVYHAGQKNKPVSIPSSVYQPVQQAPTQPQVTQPDAIPVAPMQQPVGRIEPPPIPKQTSLEAGLFDE